MTNQAIIQKEIELILEAKSGNNEAFDELINTHYGLVFSIAFSRLNNKEAAEDLAQEVFLRAWLNIKTLQNPERFTAWISSMTRNLSIDWLRKNQTSSILIKAVPMDSFEYEISDSNQVSAREKLAVKQEVEILKSMIEKLPADAKELLFLHYTEGLSYNQMSKCLGLHSTTIGRKINRVVEGLRSAVGTTSLNDQKISGVMNRFQPDPAAKLKAISIISLSASLSPQSHSALAAVAKTTAGSVNLKMHTGIFSWLSYLLNSLNNYQAILATGLTIMGKKTVILGTIAAISIGSIFWVKNYTPKSFSFFNSKQESVLTGSLEFVDIIEWSGSKSYFIPYGQSLSFASEPKSFGGADCRILMTMTARTGFPLKVEEKWEWSGQWTWQLDPAAASESGKLPGDSNFLIHSMQDGDELLLRSLVVEYAEEGMTCHVYTKISHVGGSAWYQLNEQYGNGQLKIDQMRTELSELLISNNLLPSESQPLERERWKNYLKYFKPF